VKAPAVAQAIAQDIVDTTRSDFDLLSADPVGGGCIHTALRLEGEGAEGRKRYFAKANTTEHAAMFAAEADGLDALRNAGALRVPNVVARGDDGDDAWLVLEWLELAALGEHAATSLGEALARQHRIPQARFGWARDNFIGSTPQSNGWSDDWLAFWREKRLHAQLRLAARNRLPSRMIDRGERLLADCDAFFRGYVPPPSLLHGDLWSGNAAATAGDAPVVFDPAVYVGDREADVAMTELFGGFPSQFMSAYRAQWPLDVGYPVRRDFYNLYHVLNHANLFTGGYVGRSAQSIEKLLAEIR
jgi:protein-ribulosamine 3-kinase